MSGMKEGAGEDPFADDPEPSDEATPEGTDDANEARGDRPPESTGSQQSTRRSMQIPYKYRRDGVQDGRDRVPLFLQKETKESERDALRELETRFGDDVTLTDLREAVVRAGLDHLDEVEEQLEEWGYGMTFEE